VKRHAFFRGFSFDRLMSRQLEPPWAPGAGEEAESESSSDSALTDAASSEGLAPIREDGDWDGDF